MSVLEIESAQCRYSGSVRARWWRCAISRSASQPANVVGIVGESGAGKSQAFLAAMGLLPRSARVSGSVRFAASELLGASTRPS